MKRILFALSVFVFIIAGCGITLSDYENAVLDGVSNLNLNKPEKAYEDFSRAIDIDPTRADAYVGRANTLSTLGRYEEALPDYNRAIEIDPELANAYANRGSAHSHTGQYEKAIADYEKALELDPEIDDAPGFLDRLFSDDPNVEKGIRKHLEYLKAKVKESPS
ncbi:MAG: tetratricopeptide repeat protein [Deltaproteobacteria bacterium]|jgi:tetratricopeptide (TPR) repeat protein|nr:tetratricopeptide repeat protein [Deltaproteobacteria bacterium]